MSQDPLPIAVLISGTGTNLQALIDSPSPTYRIACVVSDRDSAGGLERADKAGIPTVVVEWAEFQDRDEFTEAICDAVAEFGVGGVILAGFMRILGRSAIAEYPDAIINVHPALLPSFAGANAVEQALTHGVTQTGVTVHFVDEQIDHGPIITQQPVPVFANDDVASLHGRIQAVEHVVLPGVVDAFARGALSVSGRHVRWDEAMAKGLVR